MPPLMVSILLHYYYSATLYARHDIQHRDADAVREFKCTLVAKGALRKLEPEEGVVLSGHEADYETTEMGRVWVEKICAVPAPVQRIIWE